MKLNMKKTVSILLCIILALTMMAPGLTAFSADITMEITQEGAVVAEKLTVQEYNSIQLGYTLSTDMPEGAYVKWESNLPLLAGVDENGKVTGYDYSKAAVFQLWLDEEVRTIPLVGETTADAILAALKTAGIDLETADTATIIATVRMVAGDSIADSLQNALDNMNVEITATLYDANGNLLATDKVEVLVEMSYIAYALPTGIHITNKRAVPEKVAVGKTIQLYGAYTPIRAMITSDFKWKSSNTSVATVSETGLVTFVGAGTVTIELSFSNIALFAYTDKINFTILEQSELPVTDFTISGETSVGEGETTNLTIDKLIPEGAYTGGIIWTSADPTIAVVDQNGVVTGLDGGSGLTYSKKTDISATINGITRTVSVTVSRSLLGSTISGVNISGETALGIGTSATYTSTIAPTRLNGNSDVIKNWGIINPVTGEKIYATSSEPATDGISSMTSNGVLTGIKDGTSTIFIEATYNGTSLTDTQIVTIGVAITDFTINGTSEINEGATTQLSVSGITPSNAVYDSIVWTSSNPSIASVDQNGVVKGLDAGGNYSLFNNPSQSTTITATINGVSRSFTVTVKAKLGLNAYTGGYINGPDTLVADLPYTYTSTHTPVRMNVNRQYWGTPDNSGNAPWSTSSAISSAGNTTNDYIKVDSTTGTVTGLQAGSASIWTYMSNNVLSSSYQTLKKDVNIVELVPKSITITNPTKYDYLEGDTTLDLTGLEVKVTYDKNEVVQYYPEAINWTDEQLTALVDDYTVSEINTELLDNEQYIIVTVTRAGKSLRAIFPVLVSSKQLDSIKIAQAPQYQYTEGDTELNLDKLKVVANYLNAHSEYITGYTVNTSDFDPNLFNVEQNITVTYSHAGRTASTTFPVIVYGIPVVSVTTTPSDYSGGWTSEDVTFTLDSTNQVDGITYYYRTSPTEKWTKMEGNTLTVDTNIQQTYYFRAHNGKNLYSADTVGYAVNIDKVVPLITLTPSTTGITNQSYDVNISVDAIGASNIKSITLNGEDITGQGSFTVHENGSYTVKIESNSGLATTERIIVRNIDKNAPEITNLKIDAVNSGDYSGLNDGFGSFFKGEVKATITSKDTGVAGVDYMEYRFVDENGNPISEWTIYDNANKPVVNSQFKGYVEARAIDKAGNISDICRSEGFVVDLDNPTDVVVNATVENDVWTSNDVVVKLSSTAFSGIYKYYYSTDDGNTWIEMESDTITVSAHGITNYQFKAKSYSGRESDITTFVVKIDKVSPVVRVDFEGAFGRWTSDTVVFRFSTLNEAISGITYCYSTDNGSGWTEITTGDEIVLSENTNATYIFKAVNGAGVESNPSDTYKVMIDTVVPSIQLTPETTDYTSTAYNITYTVTTGDAGLKSVMVNGTDITVDGKYTINGNGKYVFVVTGNNNLSTTEIIEINNFDYDSPVINKIYLGNYITIIDDCAVYNDDVIVTISATETGASGLNTIQYRLLDENMNSITEWADYDENNKPVVNADFKGYVEAKVSDNVGNVSPSVLSAFFIIDTTSPEFEVVADTTTPTNENVEITVDVTNEGVTGVASIKVNGVELNINSYIANENGKYNITVTLNNGKSSTETIVISNIDKESPVIKSVSTGVPVATINGVNIYGTEPELIISAIDMGTAGIDRIEYHFNDDDWMEYDADNKVLIPDDFNGNIGVRAIDRAGNVSEIMVSDDIIVDSTKPIISVETETGQNVTYTLSGYADTGIAYFMAKVDNGSWMILDGNTFTITDSKAHSCYFKAVSNSGVESDVFTQSTEDNTVSFTITEPSRYLIRCQDSITLHTEITGNAPENTRVEWIVNNGNFAIEESENGTELTITSKNNGNTTFTAILYDNDGNVLGIDSVEMQSKAGFFDKIGGFFRNLFGSTTHYSS